MEMDLAYPKGLSQVFIQLGKEFLGSEPFLLATDENGQILGHKAGFHRFNAHLFQLLGKTDQGRIVVKFAPVPEPA